MRFPRKVVIVQARDGAARASEYAQRGLRVNDGIAKKAPCHPLERPYLASVLFETLRPPIAAVRPYSRLDQLPIVPPSSLVMTTVAERG